MRSLTNRSPSRLNLLCHNIQKAAQSANPASLFDAAAAVHLAKTFHLLKEGLLELEQDLRQLVLDANRIIQIAFPVHTSDSRDQRPPGEVTTKRALWDARSDFSFTYLRLPTPLLWKPEDQYGESWGARPSVSIADVSPEWFATLKAHYGLSE